MDRVLQGTNRQKQKKPRSYHPVQTRVRQSNRECATSTRAIPSFLRGPKNLASDGRLKPLPRSSWWLRPLMRPANLLSSDGFLTTAGSVESPALLGRAWVRNREPIDKEMDRGRERTERRSVSDTWTRNKESLCTLFSARRMPHETGVAMAMTGD